MKGKPANLKPLNSAKSDVAMDEWLNKADLTENIKASAPARGRKGPTGEISIPLPDDLIEDLQVTAAKRAIGYQTLIRMIVKENIKRYE